MREFFRGWRRKLGVLTLGVAVVLMAGWVRSMTTHDWLYFPGHVSYESFQGLLQRKHKYWVSKAPIQWRSERNHEYNKHKVFLGENADPHWQWNWFRFRFDDDRRFSPVSESSGLRGIRIWSIPYWSIVIPLTLLSAWLLCSKPRASAKPKSSSES